MDDNYTADNTGCLVRFLALTAIVLAAILVPTGLIVYAVNHGKPPSIFCASGTQLHASPATQMVGKIPVDGVEYTCG